MVQEFHDADLFCNRPVLVNLSLCGLLSYSLCPHRYNVISGLEKQKGVSIILYLR
jgi:hypothetical protein